MAKQLPVTDPEITAKDEQVSADITVRVYQPPDRNAATPLPLIVFCHGGGWISGNLETEDHMCRTVCVVTRCIVVSVDYRMFPEVNFPVPIEDCFDAYQWAYEHADALGADRKRYLIWGGSAGASLAIAVVYRLLASGQGERISGLVAMQGLFVNPPMLPEKYRTLHTSYEDNSGALPIVSGDDMKFILKEVAGDTVLDDVSQFPVHYAPASLEGFPRTYTINTNLEALRDDGTVLATVLRELSIPVKRDCMAGLPHYFWCFPVQRSGQVFRELLVAGIQWVVNA